MTRCTAIILAHVMVAAGLSVALALAACGESDPGSSINREERLRETILKFRDPDKTSFIYGCLRPPFGSSGNRAAQYGDNVRLVGTSADGISTFEVERWLAVEGPDIVRERLTYRTRDDRVIDFAYTEVNPGPPDHCGAVR